MANPIRRSRARRVALSMTMLLATSSLAPPALAISLPGLSSLSRLGIPLRREGRAQPAQLAKADPAPAAVASPTDQFQMLPADAVAPPEASEPAGIQMAPPDASSAQEAAGPTPAPVGPTTAAPADAVTVSASAPVDQPAPDVQTPATTAVAPTGVADATPAPAADVPAPLVAAPEPAAPKPMLLAQADAAPSSVPAPVTADAAPPSSPTAAQTSGGDQTPPPAGQQAPGAAPAPAPAPAPPPPQTGVVGRIIVQGNERIEPSTITSYLPIQVGDTVDEARIDLALKTLIRTDLFADVNIALQGTDLVVKVSENPIVNQVIFEGNHALKDDKLKDEVQIRPRGIFTRSKVEQDVQRIIELYRRSGRISAVVTPKIVQLPQKRVDLIFEIDEGPKSGILRINFIGNKAFGDGALRDVIITRESHWYKFFAQHTNYDPDQMEYDREQLRKFYRNHGFYDFRIVSAVAELAPDKNGFVETFTLDEGPKYHFGKMKVVTDLKRLNGELLQALLPIREGQLYQDERIERATDSLTFAAGANGFAFVDIRPEYVAHPETKTVDVTFNVREGPRVYIERIDIVGNTQTLDRVIRREMRVAEGDAYNRVLVDRSKNQIKALGFFKDVDIEQLPGSAPDKTILRVKVTEQPTGQLTFSLGYSSVEKLVGNVGITQTNFRGRGQTVDFQVELGYLRKQISLAFTEPRFLDKNMSAGFNIYTQRYDFSTQASFQTATTGVGLQTGFPINPYASVQLLYGIHTDKVTIPSYIIDPVTGKCSQGYSQSLCDEVGSSLTSSLGYIVRWDRRNDPVQATRGFAFDFGQDFAGVGGNVQYIRTTADASWYYGFTPNWIFSAKGSAGYITGWGGDVVRINDRFFKGGDNFRGFEIAGIGPRDTTFLDATGTPVGDALGGKLFGIGTLELTVPTPLPAQYGIKAALFTDFGTLGLLDERVRRNPNGTIDPKIKDGLPLRGSSGASIFWKSPMGPLRFDFAYPWRKAWYDRTENFRFSTYTRF